MGKEEKERKEGKRRKRSEINENKHDSRSSITRHAPHALLEGPHLHWNLQTEVFLQ